MNEKQAISPDFPYESRYVTALNSRMHYIDEGEGDPILFLHGMPASSYVWRNIIPYVKSCGRCIALDLIGMGKSDKPDIDYSVFDTIAYLDAFIQALNLKNLTLVMHGWGSVAGLDYAMRHSANIKALAFLEPHFIHTDIKSDVMPLSVQQCCFLANAAAATNEHDQIINTDYFVDTVLLNGVLRRLSDEELNYYRSAFCEPSHRHLFLQYLKDFPVNGEPKEVVDLISSYTKALQDSSVPKLMLYAIPGFNTNVGTIEWAREYLKNLDLCDLGKGLHYLQESNPKAVGLALEEWHKAL